MPLVKRRELPRIKEALPRRGAVHDVGLVAEVEGEVLPVAVDRGLPEAADGGGRPPLLPAFLNIGRPLSLLEAIEAVGAGLGTIGRLVGGGGLEVTGKDVAPGRGEQAHHLRWVRARGRDQEALGRRGAHHQPDITPRTAPREEAEGSALRLHGGEVGLELLGPRGFVTPCDVERALVGAAVAEGQGEMFDRGPDVFHPIGGQGATGGEIGHEIGQRHRHRVSLLV